jgi:hypothetical protein
MDQDPSIIAWEGEGSFFNRLWDTVSSATIDPIGTFARLGRPGASGSNSKALSLALITAAIGYWPYLVCAPCFALIPLAVVSTLSSTPVFDQIPEWIRNMGMGIACAGVAAFPALIFLFSLSVDVLYGVVFHILARLFGGKGDLQASMRAGLYTGLIRFWLWPVLLVAFIPMIGTILQILGRLVLLFWSGFAIFGAAGAIHGLDRDRSIAVGVLTPFIAVALLAGVWVGLGMVVWVVIAGGMHALPALPNFPR